MELVRLLLQAGADVRVSDVDGWTPAHWASYHNAEAVLALLMRYDADVNARNDRGETPLHWACKNNCARAVRVLGTSPALLLDAMCMRQETARDWAARGNSEQAMRELASLLEQRARSSSGGTSV